MDGVMTFFTSGVLLPLGTSISDTGDHVVPDISIDASKFAFSATASAENLLKECKKDQIHYFTRKSVEW